MSDISWQNNNIKNSAVFSIYNDIVWMKREITEINIGNLVNDEYSTKEISNVLVFLVPPNS